MAEQQLDGGIANAGQVVRVGSHVLRPSSPHTGSIHAFLRGEAHGVRGRIVAGRHRRRRTRAPRVHRGRGPDGALSGLELADAALASMARLMRGLHDAARGFDPQGLTWDERLADPVGGMLVCHNDVELSNVVFRDGIAVALLDFEFAAWMSRLRSGSRRPLLRPDRRRVSTRRGSVATCGRAGSAATRGRRLRPGRRRSGGAAHRDERCHRSHRSRVRHSVDIGEPNAVRLWNRIVGANRFDRLCCWWSDHQDQFDATLL